MVCVPNVYAHVKGFCKSRRDMASEYFIQSEVFFCVPFEGCLRRGLVLSFFLLPLLPIEKCLPKGCIFFTYLPTLFFSTFELRTNLHNVISSKSFFAYVRISILHTIRNIRIHVFLYKYIEM